jgi:hypothetical protein
MRPPFKPLPAQVVNKVVNLSTLAIKERAQPASNSQAPAQAAQVAILDKQILLQSPRPPLLRNKVHEICPPFTPSALLLYNHQ